MDDTEEEFQIFHKLVYETIDQWVHTDATMDNTWMQWQKWKFAGLKVVQPVQENSSRCRHS